MLVNTLTIEEKKICIKNIFKGYRKMTRKIERNLVELGFTIIPTKTHIKLLCQGKVFSCPTTASDFRSGMNLATRICRELYN